MASTGGRRRGRTLIRRLLLWHVVAVLGVLLVLGVVADRVLESYFIDQLTDSLVTDARAVQQVLSPTAPSEAQVRVFGKAIGVRVTIIRADGVVLADSEHDPSTMQNHRNRPEVRQALTGRIGVSSRVSATIGSPFRYVALPPQNDQIVRVALPLTTVHSKVRTVRLILSFGFSLAALAGVLVLWLIARSLSKPLARMTSSVEQVGAGDLGTAVPEQGTDELVVLARTVNRMREEVAARIAALEQERSAREAVLSLLEEGVVLFDDQGGVLYRNGSAERLLGAIEDVRQLTPVRLRELVSSAAGERARRSGEVVAGVTSRTLNVTAVSVPGDGRTLLVLRDVTEARAVDAVRRDFVANASHELKTPVASIQALAETIVTVAEHDPGELARFSRQLEAEAVRLSRVVADLLDLSRLEGEITERTPIRFDRIVADEAERARARATTGGLTLSVHADQPVVLAGSARDLALLVANLVENAVQYTRPGGRVDVSLTANGRVASLVVKDTGSGIPTKDQGRIFERFYRVDRARSRETGGTGLGLSIVKHVAENHGGSVDVHSALGEGSTFRVLLPCALDSHSQGA
jgi:two-component system, OmpR family, phosphate regulon sensor histidine kinase PhoR